MIKTKQELLNHFSDINEMYNNPFMYQTLSNMIDELLEQQPCEDCKVKKEAYIQGYDYGVKDWFKSKSQPCEDAINRADLIKQYANSFVSAYGVEVAEMFVGVVNQMPPVQSNTPERDNSVLECDNNALERVGDCISREEAIRIASINSMPVNECVRLIKELPPVKPQPKIDEIIKRIEETRDKDKLCEYPYNRCIDIVREVLG